MRCLERENEINRCRQKMKTHKDMVMSKRKRAYSSTTGLENYGRPVLFRLLVSPPNEKWPGYHMRIDSWNRDGPPTHDVQPDSD